MLDDRKSLNMQAAHAGVLVFAVHALVVIVVILRVLLRPHREPASRIAWVVDARGSRAPAGCGHEFDLHTQAVCRHALRTLARMIKTRLEFPVV